MSLLFKKYYSYQVADSSGRESTSSNADRTSTTTSSSTTSSSSSSTDTSTSATTSLSNASLAVKDKSGNVGVINGLTSSDISKISTAISDVNTIKANYITSSGNVASATKLATARTIALSGGATGTATSFNGTANITIPVTAVDGSKVTGTVPAATKATQDGSGNTITSKYVTLDTTQTISGTKTFSDIVKAKTPATSSNTTEVATTAWVKSKLLDFIYPVGSIYLSVNNVSPASFLGGTWSALKDRFLIGAGNSYAVNATGGSTTHTLTVAELPSHNHAFSGSSVGAHTHTLSSVLVNQWPYSYSPYSAEHDNAYSIATATTSSAGGTSISGSISSTGSNSAHSIMNPYLAVYMWKRTA